VPGMLDEERMLDRVDATRHVEPKMRRCNFCQRPYDEWRPRTQAEREMMNQALMATGPAAAEDRACCDSCWDTTVLSAPRRNNQSSYDIGGSNHGPANMILQSVYGKT